MSAIHKGTWTETIGNAKGWLGVTFLIFLVAQLTLTAAPILGRSLPVEVDDAYGYILKAEEMRTCFLQDCRALEDLRAQFTSPTTDADVAYTRAREYHRVFVIYHPLHSMALVGLRSLGLSYEAGYSLLAIAGKFLLCLGIAYWLTVLYGPKVAGATLLLLFPMVFIGQGIHTIVPSNMALGLGFIAWGLALKPRKGVGWWLLAIVLAMLLLHQAGKIYAGLALVIYFFSSSNPRTREEKTVLLTGTGLVLASFLLPLLITQPEFNFNPAAFYPGEWDYLSAFVASLNTSVSIIFVWLSAFAYSVVGLLLPIAGFFGLSAERRRNWLLTFFLFAGLLIASLGYVVPWFGALFFERAWIPLAVLLLGLVGQLLLNYAIILWKLVRAILDRKRSQVDFSQAIGTRSVWLLVLLAPALLLGLANYFPFYLRHYFLTLDNQQQRHNFTLNTGQPLSVFENSSTKPESYFLFMGEIPLYFYLTYGGLDYGAIFYPALDESSGVVWEDVPAVDYLVAANPLYQGSNNADLAVELGESTLLSMEPLSDYEFDSFDLYIQGESQVSELELEWRNGNTVFVSSVSIPALTSNWTHFAQTEFDAQSFEIRVVKGTVQIRGLRFHGETNTHWPWDVGITLRLTRPDGEPTSVEISKDQLAKGLPLELDVLNDDGYTVLARVVH